MRSAASAASNVMFLGQMPGLNVPIGDPVKGTEGYLRIGWMETMDDDRLLPIYHT